jgi:hypothetical protein
MTTHRPLLSIAVALLATGIGAVAAAPAGAAVVGVRVEGATQTLFEGPVRSAGNPVKAASDSRQRTCDTTNNAQHPTPGASATGATVEGLRSQGLDFDAKWFPGFDDYYITRFGPDAEDLGAYLYWGILIDDVFTDVGGCQAQVLDGTRVLWAYDAFHERGFLKLAALGDTGATPAPTATTLVGQPLTVRVTRSYGGKVPDFAPIGGVKVAPVTTAANGTQSVDPNASGAVTTAIDGTADLTFATPGWHRVKADGGLGGAIRSNRLDVCAEPNVGAGCGAPPADTLAREVPPLPPDPLGPATGGGSGPGSGSKAGAGLKPGSVIGAPVIELPHFTATGARSGRVSLRWRVLQPGVGVRSWSISSRAAGLRSGAFTVRATGTKATVASLRLPAGRTWTIRATFVDKIGRSVGEDVGTILVPLDAGAKGVKRTGRWSRQKDKGAWLGAVHVGRAGARLSARLAAGRVVVQVRGVRHSADVEIRSGGTTRTYRVTGSATTRTREIVAPARKRAGAVTVRIVRGQAGIDGVGVRP